MAKDCNLVSEVLRLIVFRTPSHPRTPGALTVVTSSSLSFSGSGVVGRLFGLFSTNGGLLSKPDKLRARFARPFLSGAVSDFCVSFSSFGKSSGSAKTILGVGLGPREGRGEDTACVLKDTGEAP